MQIELFTKEGCDYCDRAKALLGLNDIEYKEHKIGVNVTRDEVIKKFPNIRTVPIILIDSEYIGGYNELTEQLISRM